MRDYLVFRVYAPLCSWGDIAVGEMRPTYSHPTRSALLGFLAAACGIKRDDEASHDAMAKAYRFCVRVDAAGSMLRDYHTVQPPRSEKGAHWFTRREELLAVREQNADAIISRRDYLANASFTVCVWIADGVEPPHSLDSLKRSLEQPEFALYAGRKSCPLASPVNAQTVTADTVREAFGLAAFPDEDVPKPDTNPAFFYDECAHAGFVGYELQKVVRRDVPSSRRRWQFSERFECQARPVEAKQEANP